MPWGQTAGEVQCLSNSTTPGYTHTHIQIPLQYPAECRLIFVSEQVVMSTRSTCRAASVGLRCSWNGCRDGLFKHSSQVSFVECTVRLHFPHGRSFVHFLASDGGANMKGGWRAEIQPADRETRMNVSKEAAHCFILRGSPGSRSTEFYLLADCTLRRGQHQQDCGNIEAFTQV